MANTSAATRMLLILSLLASSMPLQAAQPLKTVSFTRVPAVAPLAPSLAAPRIPGPALSALPLSAAILPNAATTSLPALPKAVAAAAAAGQQAPAAAQAAPQSSLQRLESVSAQYQAGGNKAASAGDRNFDGSGNNSGSGSSSNGGDNRGPSLPAAAPIMTLSGVVFPGRVLQLGVSGADARATLKAAVARGGYMIAAYSPESGGDARGNSRTASLVRVTNLVTEGDKTNARMEVIRTVTIEGYEQSGGLTLAKVSYPPIPAMNEERVAQLAGVARAAFLEFARIDEEITPVFIASVQRENDALRLSAMLAQSLPFSEQTKLKLLRLPAGEARLQGLIFEMMAHFKAAAGTDEAGPDEQAEPLSSLEAFQAKLTSIGMPDAVQATAVKEYKAFSELNPKDSEASKLRTYLNWLISLPWSQRTADKFDGAAARALLDKDHFGLEKVKQRVLEFLAVRKKTGSKKGAILLFVGPPGVGKTSIASSIAAALGRKFVRLSLGGVHDESVMRGHGRTYVGALPGQIMRQMKMAGTVNPVMLLDEVDKMGRAGAQGDPTAALLEILDPQQNSTFRDQYLDVPYDLSEVLFVVTANDRSSIPGPLQDRLEIIEFDGYTPLEKLGIAERHIIPEKLKANGLTPEEAGLSKDALRKIIEGYTMESGVRNLRETIDSVFRRIAAWIETRGEKAPGEVGADRVKHYLGVEKFRHRDTTENDVGVATGLAVNDFGGSTMNVVVRAVPGSGRVRGRTQQLEMIKDSAENAFTYVRTHAAQFGLEGVDFSKIDLDVAFTPAGKIDGPSAGGLMTTAIISELSGRKVAAGLAMTGEVTPDGRILPIGGLKQKVMAAHRMGYKTVIYPAANEKDVEDIPAEVREGIRLVAVRTYDEILPLAIGEPVPGRGAAFLAVRADAAPAPVPAVASFQAAAPWLVRGPISATLQGAQVVVSGPVGLIDSFPLTEAREVLRQASFRWWNPWTWFSRPSSDVKAQESAVAAYAELLAARHRRR